MQSGDLSSRGRDLLVSSSNNTLQTSDVHSAVELKRQQGPERREKSQSLSTGQQDRPSFLAFGVNATTPPYADPQTTMQRGDEVDTMQRMLSDADTSAVTLIGSPGVGKSTLAALLYRRQMLAKQQGLPAPHYMVWLTMSNYTTLPDLIAALLNALEMPEPGLYLLRPEQQVATLARALRRPQENALIVLDQFELLLHPETQQGTAGRGALNTFLDLLQRDLGASRFLLTSYHSLYNEQQMEHSRVRSYLVSRITLPEGVALLQQRHVKGTREELSLVWQRCTGHVFALVLFSALMQLSNTPLDVLLNAPSYQALWAGDVTANLLAGVCYYLAPVQATLVNALSLFTVPAPAEGIIMTITGSGSGGQYGQMVPIFEREISRLSSLGLLQPMLNASGMPCYTLHPLLRQYLQEHFAESERGQFASSTENNSGLDLQKADARQTALAAGHSQVANYYRYRIAKRCPPREQRQGPQDVEYILGAIRHLCLAWRWQRACDLLFEEGLHESMVQWGTWNTLLGLYTAMLPPLGVLLSRDEGLISSHVAMLYGRMGEYQQSLAYFDRALAAQRQSKDAQAEAMTLANQGELLRIHGNYTQARACFERAMSIEQKADPQLRCVLLHNIGLLSQHDKEYDQALQCYTEALHLASQQGRQDYTGMILTNLGLLLYEQQERKEGMALLMAALRMRENLQDAGAPLLERFLAALEQKMGNEAYTQFCREAIAIQQDVFARFAPPDMRQ